MELANRIPPRTCLDQGYSKLYCGLLGRCKLDILVSRGYEYQVNTTHGDWRKTGSIYSFQDPMEPGQKDGE